MDKLKELFQNKMILFGAIGVGALLLILMIVFACVGSTKGEQSEAKVIDKIEQK